MKPKSFFALLLIALTLIPSLPAYSAVSPRDKAELSGEVITNGGAESMAAGFTTYADAAQAIPVDGTGGSPSHITVSSTTTSPLDGNASLLITNSGSTSAQGEGVAYAFTIPAKWKGTTLGVSFDYLVNSGTFVAGSDSTDSDIEVYFVDVTNSQVIQPVGYKLTCASSTVPCHYSGTFPTNYNSTSYRLLFHVATANTSAWSLKVDSIGVGSQKHATGPPVIDFRSCTVTGNWSTNTTYTCLVARTGDRATFKVRIATSGAPNATTASINLPSGYTIDTTKLLGTEDSQYKIDNHCTIRDAGTASFDCEVDYSNTSAIVIGVIDGTSTYTKTSAFVSNTVPMTWANGDFLEAEFTIPILGWSSNVQMSSESTSRRVTAIAKFSSTTGVSTSTVFNYDSIVKDDTGSITTGSGWKFTAPSEGFYNITLRIQGSIAASSDTNITLLKNGSSYNVIGNVYDNKTRSFSAGIYLNAGDYIQIENGATALTSMGSINEIEISRNGASGTLAASDTVAAKYTNSGGQSAPNGALTLTTNWSRIYDTTGSFDTATGVYKCQIPGKYRVEAWFAANNNTYGNIGAQINLKVVQAGSKSVTQNIDTFMIQQTSAPMQATTSGSDEFDCLAGDTLKPVFDNGTTSTLTMSSGIWVTFHRVGN